MSAIPSPKTYAPEEYLSLERSQLEGKCEYVEGNIYAMVGASRKHNLISVNLATILRGQLKGRPCEAYVNDMRVKAAKAKAYFYPDVVVVCGKPELEDEHADTLLNPTVLIEILSPSTEAYDRGDKFSRYRRIESLQEFILVAQDKPSIERYVRQGETWLLTEISGLESSLSLESIGCTLPLREVYDRISEEFGEAP